MAAKLEKTRTPGIYKRGSRYVFSYRVAGKQRWESCRTLDEARRAKSARVTDIGRGEFEARSRVTLHEYAKEWVGRYQGRGRRGFREATRDEYKRQLEQYALKYFPSRTRLTDVTPSAVAGFISWLCEQTKPAPTKEDAKRRLPLTDKTIRNTLGPLRACLASAVREGLIRSNPAREVDLPHREAIIEDDDDTRALSREELAAFLRVAPQRHRVLFDLLASTGLRISEAIGLQWRHVHLDGSSPHVKVRRAIVKGVIAAPKSKRSRRDVPITPALVVSLRRSHRDTEWPGEDDPVFPSLSGSPLQADNLRRRELKPAAEEAGVPWMGFHTLRHTCASMLFAEGRNAVQVQRWLGHHSAAFTLSRYVHLLDNDLGEALDLAKGANEVRTEATPLDAIEAETTAADLAA